jgi:hypothetical protein
MRRFLVLRWRRGTTTREEKGVAPAEKPTSPCRANSVLIFKLGHHPGKQEEISLLASLGIIFPDFHKNAEGDPDQRSLAKGSLAKGPPSASAPVWSLEKWFFLCYLL